MFVADLFMVFDVESGGLHGAAFAAGYVVASRDGVELASGLRHCGLELTGVRPDTLEWLKANVRIPDDPALVVPGPRALREWFWQAWREWKEKGALLAADVPWPVEARFLAACVDDDPRAREWQGPYPLVDVASVRLAAGLDPLAPEGRLPDELPAHDPLADARQSARLLREALAVLDDRGPR